MQLLYAVGIVVGLIILWQGYKAFQVWQKRIRVKLEPVPAGSDKPEAERFSELGAVRVRPREVPIISTGYESADKKIEPTFDGQEKTTESRQHDEKNASMIVGANVSEAVSSSEYPAESAPVLTQERRANELSAEEIPKFDGSADSSAPTLGDIGDVAILVEEDVPVLLSPTKEQAITDTVTQLQADMFADEPIVLPAKGALHQSDKETHAKVAALYGQTVEPVRSIAKQADNCLPQKHQKTVLLYVVSKDADFHGEDLLRCILNYGLRFGEQSFFHRHEQPTGRGQILFTMVNATEQGTFDLDNMSAEAIPAVIFYITLPGVSSITAFDLMLDTARRLANELGGDVLDEKKERMTLQLTEHYREQVQTFERERLSGRIEA